jgi:hypothetical protein
VRIYDHPLPIVWDESPRARRTDPIESHLAAGVSDGKRVPQKVTVYRVLAAETRPLTADQVFKLARRKGWYCTPSRVRTILAEHAKGNKYAKQGEYGSEFTAVSGGKSDAGCDARLWTLTLTGDE